MTESDVRYSDRIKGDESNYEWVVKYDDVDGAIGITQWCDGNKVERVLLSPAQAQKLVKFISSKDAT